MAASSSYGLKDILNPPPAPNSKPITKPLVSSTSPFDVGLAQKFEELSVEGSASSSPLSSPSSPTLPFSVTVPSETNCSLNLEKNLQREKVESESPEGNGSYHERNLGKEMEDTEKKNLTGKKCFPPPISCLRKIKVGKPYRYLTYDKESERYVVEEIKIPNGSLFRASREDGRLKLYMNLPDEEESEGN